MVDVELQNVSECADVPSEQSMRLWAQSAVKREQGELVIRVVDEDESAELNECYRRKSGPTNVLSFPFEAPPGIESAILGDLVICAPIVAREAEEQGKTAVAHWAHIVVHGVLHLEGLDHVDEEEALTMEAEEVTILRRLGFPNPYGEEEMA